jgi:hypothetical protein
MQEVVWGHSDINCKNSNCKELMPLGVMTHSSVNVHYAGIWYYKSTRTLARNLV